MCQVNISVQSYAAYAISFELLSMRNIFLREQEREK